MRFHRSVPLFLLLVLVLATPEAARAQLGTSLTTRWNAPSTLTPSQAASVLAREARGEAVSPSQLFEARKHLRTDRSVSLGGAVMQEVVEELLAENLDSEVRIRFLPPVLHWLDPESLRNSAGQEILRLRGESVMLSALNGDPNLAASALLHFTYHEDWRWCGGTVCIDPLPGPVRSAIGYELTVPLDTTAPGEAQSSTLILDTGFTGTVHNQTVPALDPSRYLGAACDPLPSSTATGRSPDAMSFVHLADRTEAKKINRVLCGFFAIPGTSDARFTYSVDGAVAGAPPEAGSAANVNNPLYFRMFE